MQQLILNIKDESQLPFLTELLTHFNFVEIAKPKNGQKPKGKLTAAQREFVDDLKQALHEVELHQQGKIHLKTARELHQEIEPKRKRTAAEQEFMDDLKESFRDINLHLQGKITLKDARELLNEPI